MWRVYTIASGRFRFGEEKFPENFSGQNTQHNLKGHAMYVIFAVRNAKVISDKDGEVLVSLNLGEEVEPVNFGLDARALGSAIGNKRADMLVEEFFDMIHREQILHKIRVDHTEF
jgi:hypothetical protein